LHRRINFKSGWLGKSVYTHTQNIKASIGSMENNNVSYCFVHNIAKRFVMIENYSSTIDKR